MKLRNLFLLGALTIVAIANAQITLDGEIRPRTEYRHGYSTLSGTDQEAALFTDQRTRLNFGFKNELVKTYISVQDIRVWGSTSQLNRTDAYLSVHQAWAQFPLKDALSLKVGRQEIILDDHRIFGSVNWATQARSHDAAILKYDKKGLKVDLSFAYNQGDVNKFGNYYGVDKNYKTMQYLWLHKDVKDLGISVLALNTGAQVSLKDSAGKVTDYETRAMQTVGTRLTYKKDKFNASLNGYAQLGAAGTWVETDVNAYLVGIDFSYEVSKKLKISAGFELISGTSQVDTANTENNSFNPLFGTNHKFNGFMDYFYVGNHGGSVGLQDIYVKLNTSVKKVKLGADVHLFSAAADVKDASTLKAMNASLGSEIDVYGAYPINDFVMLKGGYSQMFATETLQTLIGGDLNETNNWGWLMIIIKPKFN